MKRLMTILFSIFIVFNIFSITAYSEEIQSPDFVNELQNFRILKGDGEDIELDKEISRIEAAVLMVRMLGCEDDINNYNSSELPYTDVPEWGVPYVNYLYSNNYIKGINAQEFGSTSTISAKAYLTLMLRALGYEENKDYTYEKAYDFSEKIGLITPDDLSKYKSNKFTEYDAAYLTYKTLISKLPDNSEYLVQKLSRNNFIIKMGLKNFDGGKYFDKNLLDNTENELVDLWNSQKGEVTDKSTFDSDSQPVIFLGDSLTEGLTMTDTYDGFNILNKGVNGNKVEDMFSRLNTDVLNYNPKVIFIMAGTNNLWEGDDINAIAKTYDKILYTIKNILPDCKVYVQENIPFGKLAYDNNSALSQDTLQQYNIKIQQLAQKYGYEYLFIGDLYKDSDGFLNSEYTKDGIHLKLEYYSKWIDEIKNRIK